MIFLMSAINMEALAKKLLFTTTFRALNPDDYNFILLDTNKTVDAREYQRKALSLMDDPIRQSTRIKQDGNIYYWIGQDHYRTAMWVPKNVQQPNQKRPRTPAPIQQAKVEKVSNWAETKLNVYEPSVLENNGFQKYVPQRNLIYAIGPGLNRVGHLMKQRDGSNFTVFVQELWDSDYDNYEFRNPNGKNLRNAASKFVITEIRRLIQEGRGPAAIVCGSRGGQETMVELVKYWRGLVFDFNGGFLTACQREFAQIPDGIQIVSILGREDFFYYTYRSCGARDMNLFQRGHLPRDFRDYGRRGPNIPRQIGDQMKVIRNDTQFNELIKNKTTFISNCVGNTKHGEHLFFASDIIDHSLDELDGRRLILSVMFDMQGLIRDKDYVYKISYK